MRFIKRLLFILGMILLMLVITALLAAPQLIIDFATLFNTEQLPQRVFQLVLALLIDALLLLILYRSLRSKPAEGLTVRARGVKAEVNVNAVQRQINARMADLSDVLAVQTEVMEERGAARVTLRVRTAPDIVVPEKQKEISRVLRQVVEKQLGLRLAGNPAIHIDLAQPESAKPAPAPVEAPPVEPDPEPPPAQAAIPLPAPASESATVPVEPVEPEPAPEPPPEDDTLILPPEPVQPTPPESPPPAPEPAPPDEPDEPWRAFLLEDDDYPPES